MNNPPIFFHLTFIEPYRLREKEGRKDRYQRGSTFARLRRQKNDNKGWIYITGTLLRSAVIRAAEELLCLKWKDGLGNERACCQGHYKQETDEQASPPHSSPEFLRKRSTLKWWEGEKKEKRCGNCPLCILLGENRNPSFDNLRLVNNPISNTDHLLSERIVNRVDFDTGKAQDYFKIWEADPDYAVLKTFEGVVKFEKGSLNDKQVSSFKKLLIDSLKFVDKLCGAQCVITVTEEADENREAKPPANEKGKTSLIDTNITECMELTEDMNDLESRAKEMVQALSKQDQVSKARLLADAVYAFRQKGPGILEKRRSAVIIYGTSRQANPP